VAVGSALDAEAALRGNSVYFPERVVPMLPEVLSNGLCSLNPQVDRLAMAVEITLSRSGELRDFRFCEAVIRSQARLTYTQVGNFLAGEDDAAVPPALHRPVRELHALYRVLRTAREARGAIDFETTETRILFNEQRKIESIVPVVRNDAHKLIEECMLCANVAAARFFDRHALPVLYRVHEGPGEEKLENLRAFLGELGLGLRGGAKPSPEDYQRLLEHIGERPDAHIIQTMLLRSLSQAVYQADNKGHFGLNYPEYTHFTSPIRRYPDLLVHRAIRSVIRSKTRSSLVRRVRGAAALPRERIYPYDEAAVVAIGEQCSMTERRADDATREVQAWLKCEYLLEHVGDEFDGVVSAVTNFGLFVELNDLYIEGLVHISNLPGDYYQFDVAQQRLVGERSGRSFQLGAPLRVLVAAVNLDERKIDLEPVALPAPRKQRAAGDTPQPLKKKTGGARRGRGSGKRAAPDKGTGGGSDAAAAAKAGKSAGSGRRRGGRGRR
jgi:ribonuclease R